MSLYEQKLQHFLDNNLSSLKQLRILEAGCGSLSRFYFGDDPYIVGIDISQYQLDRNENIKEKILGDIQYYDLSQEVYDVVICWYVLEHLSHPELALQNFVKTVKTGGYIIVSLPNINSLKGKITKYTPHWFHLMFYRVVMGKKTVGLQDNGPFKTVLSSSIAPEKIEEFANIHRLSIVYKDSFDWIKGGLIWQMFIRLNNIYKYIFDNLNCDNELIYILQK